MDLKVAGKWQLLAFLRMKGQKTLSIGKMYYLCKQNHLKDTIMNIGDRVPEILGSEVKK